MNKRQRKKAATDCARRCDTGHTRGCGNFGCVRGCKAVQFALGGMHRCREVKRMRRKLTRLYSLFERIKAEAWVATTIYVPAPAFWPPLPPGEANLQ